MMNDTYDDKDDTAYGETMNHGKSSQKKGESSRDKKRSGSDAQRKSGGRDRGGTPLEHGQLDATTPMTPNYAHNEPSFTTGSLGPGPRQGRKTSAVDDLAHTPTAQTL